MSKFSASQSCCYLTGKASWGIFWICDTNMKKENEVENINKTIANNVLSTQKASTLQVYMTVLVWWNTIKGQGIQKIQPNVNPFDISSKYKQTRFFIALYSSNAGIQFTTMSFPIFQQTHLSSLSPLFTAFFLFPH